VKFAIVNGLFGTIWFGLVWFRSGLASHRLALKSALRGVGYDYDYNFGVWRLAFAATLGETTEPTSRRSDCSGSTAILPAGRRSLTTRPITRGREHG